MNFISAKNGNRVQNTIARDVVRHCIKQLMPRMKTLDISVIFKKIPEKENTIGTCLMQDNNRSFEIEIQKGRSKVGGENRKSNRRMTAQVKNGNAKTLRQGAADRFL